MQAFLLGRLGRDSETKDANGKPYLRFTVADDVGFGDKKTTQWVTCTLWGPRAAKLTLVKGSQVMVWGELTLREYITKDQEKRTTLELNVSDLKFAGPRPDGVQTQQPIEVRPLPSYSEAALPLPKQEPTRRPITAASYAADDDDIPF